MRFTKMQGIGNDYIYMDCVRGPMPKDPSGLSRKIADRHFGVGADGLILTEEDLGPLFFDLRSGLAGDALQKFVNYRVHVAIVVPTPQSHGERFVELAREHSKHPMVRFFATEDAARAWLRTV